eukprot:scaffold5980_cov192-Amphora_coffeaeformis.AAC.6
MRIRNGHPVIPSYQESTLSQARVTMRHAVVVTNPDLTALFDTTGDSVRSTVPTLSTVGPRLGRVDGSDEGSTVGRVLGTADSEGMCEGKALGSLDKLGKDDGTELGVTVVGVADGAAVVGSKEGATDREGKPEGSSVVATEGRFVGRAVGATGLRDGRIVVGAKVVVLSLTCNQKSPVLVKLPPYTCRKYSLPAVDSKETTCPTAFSAQSLSVAKATQFEEQAPSRTSICVANAVAAKQVDTISLFPVPRKRKYAPRAAAALHEVETVAFAVVAKMGLSSTETMAASSQRLFAGGA